MSTPVPAPTVPTAFQTYAAAIFSGVVLVAGGLQSVLTTFAGPEPLHAKIASAIVFAILVAGAVITFGVKLLPGKWQGGAKTGVAIVAALLAVAVPYFANGTFNLTTDLPLVIVAVVNALATQFGVTIRTAA